MRRLEQVEMDWNEHVLSEEGSNNHYLLCQYDEPSEVKKK